LPKNDEGEFELVLGNRQLISVFLIVVILLGVFFSMGYIVGRNSTPTAPTETARVEKAPERSTPSDSQREPENSGPDAAAPAQSAAGSESAPAPVSAAPITTQPERPAPAPAKPAPATVSKEPKPKPAPSPPPAPERAAVTGQPSTGDYWQVVATARPDAEIIAEALAKRGFHAVLAPAPKEGIFRVLVGPLEDASTQARTRTSLEAAGFKNPIMRKY
jgi:cell division septation protein DedD